MSARSRTKLRFPKKSTNERDAAEAKAKSLLSEAVQKIGVADGLKDEANVLAGKLSSLTRKSIRAYWEAGSLLAQARESAPHGTWGKLRDAAGLAPTTEYLWRDLYQQVSEQEIDRLIGLDYTISDVIDEYEIGRKKTRQPESLTGPAHMADRGLGISDVGDQQDGATHSAQADVEPEPPTGALRVWKESKKDNTVVHAANWRGKILCTGRIIDEAADSLGDESDVTCIKCLGIRTRSRLEAERREREKTPHGSEIGYVWEILDGDDPDAIDARWLPIREVHGQVIVTPEKTYSSSDPVYRDRREALETIKAKYQHLVEQDQAEIDRLKAESARLNQDVRLAEKKLSRIEALLGKEA